MKLLNFITIIAICITLTACNRLTQDNFDKIKTDMTQNEVTSILGKPTNSDSISIAGVSGTSSVWRNNDVEITIQFLNGKVFLKSYSNVGKQKKD